jgi:DNA-binding HxlR family transcriptional regulator
VIGDPHRFIYAVTILYATLVAIPLTYYLNGSSVPALVPYSLISGWETAFRPLERAFNIFGPSLILANIALILALLALSTQLNDLIQLSRARTGGLPEKKRMALLRRRGVIEIVAVLSDGPATQDDLRRKSPIRIPVRPMLQALRELEEEGFVIGRLRPDGEQMEFNLSEKGQRVAIGLLALVQ